MFLTRKKNSGECSQPPGSGHRIPDFIVLRRPQLATAARIRQEFGKNQGAARASGSVLDQARCCRCGTVYESQLRRN